MYKIVEIAAEMKNQKGYWDPSRLPFLSRFLALSPERQREVVVAHRATCHTRDFDAAAAMLRQRQKR